MDFGALRPEINSGRMYAGAGSGPLLAAAAAWSSVGAEMRSATIAYHLAIAELTTGWMGPSSMAMVAAASPYMAWMSATASQAELTATQALAAVGAYEAAFAMTVPPGLIAANRAQRMMLVATNVLGQNTPAIAACDAHYGEMWAQDAAAMYGYAANSAVATSKLTAFTGAPQTTTNSAGSAEQVARSAGKSAGTGVQSTLSHLVSSVPAQLQSLASPNASSGGLGGILSGLSSAVSTSPFGATGQSLFLEYADIPGWFGMFVASGALTPLMSTPISSALTATAVAPVAAADGAADSTLGAAGADVAEGADVAAGTVGSGAAADLGGFANVGGLPGLGQAGSVGALTVPPSWGWASTGPASMLGSVPVAMPLASAADTELGAGLGFPFVFGGVPPAGAGGAGAAAAPKYGTPLPAVMAQPPDAEPAQSPKAPLTAGYQGPPGLPPAPPPGYTVYVYAPTNGAPAGK